jgi:NAD-dependent SIR2 family protein deacetylase
MARAKSTTRGGLRRDLIDAVGVLMTQARSALFITGPGLSADSGLTHYRGLPGVLRKSAQDGKLIETALSIDTLSRKPKLTWRYLLEMDRQVTEARPSRGHEVLVALERALQRTAIMTTNVDRLHQRAGSRNVIEMHGALHDLQCARCEMSTRHDSYALLPMPPTCALCGSVLRPDMPLFGESLPADPFTRHRVRYRVCGRGQYDVSLSRQTAAARQAGGDSNRGDLPAPDRHDRRRRLRVQGDPVEGPRADPRGVSPGAIASDVEAS